MLQYAVLKDGKMGILNFFKNRAEIKVAKEEIERAKENICTPRMKDLCVAFADDIIKLVKKLNILQKQNQYREFDSYLELISFGTSIIIAAYHGDGRTLPKLYQYLLDKTMDKYDKRINIYLSNIYGLVDDLAIKVWPEHGKKKNELFYSDVIQRIGEYGRSIQKDELTGNLKFNNTLNNLIKNYSSFEDKLSENDKNKLTNHLYEIFLPFYQRCAEIFYPVDAMLKLYPLT